MNWRFWRRKKLVDESEKEFLLHCRERMLEAAYIMRLADKVCSRYFYNSIDEDGEVKKVLWDNWGPQSLEITNIWHAITHVETRLHQKYGMEFLDAGLLDTLRFDLLDSNLKRAMQKHDRNMLTVRPGRDETDRPSFDA